MGNFAVGSRQLVSSQLVAIMTFPDPSLYY